jgi:cell wall-associated NlpC family hydrolase
MVMKRTQGQGAIHVIVALGFLAACTNRPASLSSIPPHAVVGVRQAQLDPEFWIARQANAEKTVLAPQAIAEQNSRLLQLDSSVYDIENFPPTLTAAKVRSLILELSRQPDDDMFDAEGRKLEQPDYDALSQGVALDSVPESQRTRYGLVVKRADLRTFPTTMRAYKSRADRDIDRFQESALFPGAPVVIAHESHDGKWWFVVSPLYAAWVEKQFIAEGAAEEVFAYTRKSPYLVVTGATAKTVYTPARPEVSELQLDMGVRVPLLADWPQARPVNGQHPYTAHVIELPERAADGSLRFTPALLPRTADTSTDYLPLSRANLLRQGFKFLGERYGWGHSYNARDCSGFVSDVYRSFGVQLPRNTRDQSVTPAINRIAFTSADDVQRRLEVLRRLEVGDLIYIPGHVMMVIGHENGMPYVIHDTTGISYRDGTGEVARVVLNGVSVTPLTPLLISRQPLVEHITSIVRVRP